MTEEIKYIQENLSKPALYGQLGAASMKSVMVSIRPEWVNKITKREKTLEVRKTAPDFSDECKVFIYCTKHFKGKGAARFDRGFADMLGKVVGEFTCKRIDRVDIPYPAFQNRLDKKYVTDSCVPYYELHRYAYHDDLYFWYISDLVIYDNPKSLSEFGMERPPQSWCYVGGKTMNRQQKRAAAVRKAKEK